MPDAVVVGSGPNGLAAAIAIARTGRSVTVYEANEEIGGGTRSAELIPGFTYDVCSAIHTLAAASPFFRTLALERHGLEWVHPDAPLAHPLDDGTAVVIERSLDATARGLGDDAGAYLRLMGPLVAKWQDLYDEILGPVVHLPRHPILLARFGLRALWPVTWLARSFRTIGGRAVLAGMGAHSFLPMEHPLTGAFALMLGVGAHAVGWPVARGGSGAIARALAEELRAHGGVIVAGHPVQQLTDVPTARAYLFDTAPAQLARIAEERLPSSYRSSLLRYRRGPGVFKIDYAIDGTIPWRAAECLRAGTVHLGGTLEEIAESERAVWRGRDPERPFVLVGQQSNFDRTRAPEGKNVVWAYCHVPNGSTVDMTSRIEAQLERFAPGFRDRVIERRVTTPRDVERANGAMIGGDISNGSHGGMQLIFRPTPRLDPYATPARDLYLCSAATPPGGGVHGMSGYHAARSALARVLS